MRRLGFVLAVGLLLGGWLLIAASPAAAELKTSVTGQVRFNIIYADRIVGEDQTIPPTTIPFDSGPKADKEKDNSHTVLDARRTRLQVVISDTVGNIKLGGLVQGDFQTTDGNAKTSNSRHFRLRLAQAQATTPEGFTIRFGQVRTIVSEYGDNLIGGVAAPDVMNDNGHFDQIQARHPGIHIAYTTKAAGGDLTIGAGIEKQAVSMKSRTGLAAGVDEGQGSGQDVPLFGGGVRYRSPMFALFARGAVAKARVILSGTGKDEDEGVWLGAIGVEVRPMPMFQIEGQYHATSGLGRLNASFVDAALVGGKLEAVDAQGFHVSAQLKPTKDLRFNVIYEWQKADDDPKIFDLSSTSGDKEKFQAFRVNFIKTFWTRWQTGVEYIRGEVDSFGKSDGSVNAIDFRLWFFF